MYRVAASLLRRGQPNVLLIRVTNGAFDGGIDGPIALGIASHLLVKPGVAPSLSRGRIAQEADASVLRMSAPAGNYEYHAEFRLPAQGTWFTRRLSVTNRSTDEQLFQTMSYATPPLAVGADAAVVFPGSLPIGDTALQGLSDGMSVSPRSSEPLAVLWSQEQQRGLGAWFYCEEEYAPVSVRRAGAGAAVSHRQNVIVRLKPGETVSCGLQFVWLVHGPREAALGAVQDAYRQVGLRVPEGGLAGLRGMTIYCGHPGGPPELGFLRYGGFPALTKYVDTLQRMHVDLLWLLPTWDHGGDGRWNLYSPFDHFQVDRLLGTADDLKSLSSTCAASNIGLMFDLVPHGPPDFTPLAKEHPEWAAQGGWIAAVRVEPAGLRQPSSRLAGLHAPRGPMERAGIRRGGARVDCAAGGPLNWNRDVTNRPSLSSLAAGLGMNRAIRAGYASVHPGVVLLPEEYTGAAIFCSVGDLTYDAQFYFLQAELLAGQAPPEQWAQSFQQFLHDQALYTATRRAEDALDQQPRYGFLDVSETASRAGLRARADARAARALCADRRRADALPG